MQVTRFAVDHHLGQAADARRHHRHAARHRFERREAEALLQRRQQEQIRLRQQPDDVLGLADHLDMRRQAKLPDELLRFAPVGPLADDRQPRGDAFADAREDLDHGVDLLDRPQVRDVHHQLLARRAQARAQRRIRRAAMEAAIQEIRDHFDRALDRHLALGVVAQARGNRRHRIGLIDAKRHRFAIRGIGAENRDVGAVQRRDGARHVRAGRRGEDLPGQVRRGGMRDGVMRVDDVELMRARHLHQPVGEREQVLRFAEQRIARRVDAMKADPRVRLAQPERRLAADDVRLVAASREAARQLGGDHAASAHRGIADDPDVHLSSVGRAIGSRAITPSAKSTPMSAPNCASRLSISCRKRRRGQPRRPCRRSRPGRTASGGTPARRAWSRSSPTRRPRTTAAPNR